MIKLNLLPDEFKKVQGPKETFKFEFPKFGPKVYKIGIYILSVWIGLHLLLTLSCLLKTNSLKKLNSKWRHLEPNKKDIDKLNSELGAIEKKVLPIRSLVEKRVLWAKKLNQLNDLITPGIWFTKLFIEMQVKDAQRGDYIWILTLEGSAASLYGEETALVGKLIKALQEDKEFFQHFSEIKLGPMEKAMLEKIPIMNFKIFCYLRKE